MPKNRLCILEQRIRRMLNVYLEYCLDGYNIVKEKVNSPDDLKTNLQHINNEAAGTIQAIFCVDIVVEKKGRLSIGLDNKSILTYISEDFDEALTSLGDKFAQGETMYYLGEYSLMSNKYVIPFAKAIAVVEYWILHGELSDAIEWTDEIF